MARMSHKEGYYAALERQRAGEVTLRERFERPQSPEQREAEALEELYTEMGMKAFDAFNSCLEWLSNIGRGSSGGASLDRRVLDDVKDAITSSLSDLSRNMSGIKERIDRLESAMAAMEAGMRRIDKFTLEAFRNIQEIEERFQNQSLPSFHQHHDVAMRGRLPKEEAARLALEAAEKMRNEGRRLTLAAVAREAGLKYGQIVYAFGNKDGFLDALQSVEVQDENGTDTSSNTHETQGQRAEYEETASA